MSIPKPVFATQMVARVVFLIQLVLGVLLWTGRADSVRNLHIAVGLVLVIDLWVASAFGLRRGAPVALVALAIAWSLGMPALGLLQESILPGSAHVVIQVLHLLIGIIGVGLVEGLARSPGRGARAPA
jgi:hypothetical protein